MKIFLVISIYVHARVSGLCAVINAKGNGMLYGLYGHIRIYQIQI